MSQAYKRRLSNVVSNVMAGIATNIDSALSAPLKPSLVARLSKACSNNGKACLAIIVVLVIIVIGMYIKYHGFLGIGPFSKQAKRKNSTGGTKAKLSNSSEVEGAPPAADPETQQLIDTINKS